MEVKEQREAASYVSGGFFSFLLAHHTFDAENFRGLLPLLPPSPPPSLGRAAVNWEQTKPGQKLKEEREGNSDRYNSRNRKRGDDESLFM